MAVAQSWKNYDIVKTIVNINESINEINSSTINASWQFWREDVDGTKTPPINIVEIVDVARNVETKLTKR